MSVPDAPISLEQRRREAENRAVANALFHFAPEATEQDWARFWAEVDARAAEITGQIMAEVVQAFRAEIDALAARIGKREELLTHVSQAPG
jgi:hypothetical protein